MLLHDSAHALQQVRAWQSQGLRVAFVPTMGALHAGHLSLVAAAKRSCDKVVVSIFVNPTQFGPLEDFSKYPRTLEDDVAALAGVQCDLVFSPAVEAIYPPGASTFVEPPACGRALEGECRPGHFRGVCTVVLKLFQLIPADVAVFGRKDFQQALVIRAMVRDLLLPIAIDVQPTIREPDGLAMSSRNRYLSPDERRQALALSRALAEVARLRAAGERSIATLEQTMRDTLTAAGVTRIDYATIRNPQTLEPPPDASGPIVTLIACYVGGTRLIDNEMG